jgi:hypothetical protein
VKYGAGVRILGRPEGSEPPAHISAVTLTKFEPGFRREVSVTLTNFGLNNLVNSLKLFGVCHRNSLVNVTQIRASTQLMLGQH